jgi:hypothetical protein
MKVDRIGHFFAFELPSETRHCWCRKKEGNIAGTRKEEEYVSSCWISLRGKILEFERRNIRYYSVENSLLK